MITYLKVLPSVLLGVFFRLEKHFANSREGKRTAVLHLSQGAQTGSHLMHQFKAYQGPKAGGLTRKAPTSSFTSELYIRVHTVPVPIHQENTARYEFCTNNLLKASMIPQFGLLPKYSSTV